MADIESLDSSADKIRVMYSPLKGRPRKTSQNKLMVGDVDDTVGLWLIYHTFSREIVNTFFTSPYLKNVR
jgi:hypothetical protein